MAVTLTINGTGYSFPQTGEAAGWGDNVTNWASAVTTGMLQKSGGSFALTAEVDFGATYGLKSPYFLSATANSASAGALRLAQADDITWRNAANSANLALDVSSDAIRFAGVALVDLSTAQTLTSKSIDSDNNTITNIVNADIKASAGIALDKLAATTASRALVSDVSGFVSAATTTSTEIGYVNGVTSAIQTQLDAKASITGTETLTNKTLTAPTINGGTLIGASTLSVNDNSTNDLIINSSDGTLSADRTLNIDVTDADRTIDLAGNLTLSNSFTTAGGHTVTFNTSGNTSVTLPTSGTLSANSAATPTVAGIVTSYIPTIQSSVLSVNNTDSPVTLTATDGYRLVVCDTSSGAITVNLPAIASSAGREIVIKNLGGNAVTIDPNGAETIDGASDNQLSGQYSKVTLFCDGTTEWHTVSAYDYIEGKNARTGTSMTSNTDMNVTSVTLTPGVWNLTGVVGYAGGSTPNVTQAFAWISQTSATAPAAAERSDSVVVETIDFNPQTQDKTLATPSVLYIISSDTIVYLGSVASFTGGTVTAYGTLKATRVG